MCSDFLERVKLSLRVAGDDFDEEIKDLMRAALLDLGITDINSEVLNEAPDPLVKQAVITYVKIHFGEPDEYDRLKASYFEQKAQLLMASNYTDFTEVTNG